MGTARTVWSDLVITSDSVIKLVSVLFGKCTTLVVRKRSLIETRLPVVNNEMPRNKELFDADQ